ncbi:MAG: DUF2007 domain-containing protein [Verrucomicrobiota bacterium]
MTHSIMSLVTVFRAFSPAEAQLVRSRLDAANIPAVVNHELAALSMDGYSMATGGILVQVPAEEAIAARELLDAPPPPPDGPAIP